MDPLASVRGAVRIVEVGPRDGLQNQPTIYSTETKRRLVEALFAAGLREVEVTSFVRADRVPQLADADALLPLVLRPPSWTDMDGQDGSARVTPFPSRLCLALVANERGLERALAAGARHVSVIAAASDGFSRANSGKSADEGIELAGRLAELARARGCWVRGYVSTCFRDPYDGPVAPARAVEACQRVAAAGVDEVVVSDTLGDADPRQVVAVCQPLISSLGADRLALHLHDTDGMAMASLLVALEIGLRSFDGSVGGLGGCPFAPGAAGNLATERIVRLCDRIGLTTGVDMVRLQVARAVLGDDGAAVTPAGTDHFAALRAGSSRREG
jgi:hydroxymethylglutaryl-CoA lyase